MSMVGMRDGSGGGGSAGAGVALVMAASAVAIFAGGDAQRVLLTAVLTMMLYAVISFSPAVGLPMMLAYLASVGISRRYAIPLFGYTTTDPLLLVGPAVVGMFFANKLIARTVPNDTLLSKGIIAVLIVMTLAALNPLQGGVAVGLSGILFFAIPVLWYYCAREFGTARIMDAMLRGILFVALVGMAYGLYQTYYGLSQVERDWIALTNNDRGQFVADNVMRVFSIFSSFAEYARFLCLGAIVAFAWALKRNKFAIVLCLVFFVGLALSSSRGALLTGVFGCVLIWAVQGKTFASWGPRIALALVVGGLAMYFGLTQIRDSGAKATNDTTETLLKHQAKGLLDPFDDKKSTGGFHIKLFFQGIVLGFENPLGLGLGTSTIGSAKFGGTSVGVESDIANMFLSTGFIGGFLFTWVVGYGVWRVALSWYKRRDFVSLASLGILFSSIGMWTGAAQYATTMICWFLIGAVDRMDAIDLAAERLAKRQKATAGTEAAQQRPEATGRRLPA